MAIDDKYKNLMEPSDYFNVRDNYAPKPSLLSGDADITAAKEMQKDKWAAPSGATSSEQKPAYHLIPTQAIKALAQRFALGRLKHGDVNYQKCIKTYTSGSSTFRELDLVFIRDRFDHGLEHLLNLKSTGGHRDDNIGAVLWFCAIAAWVESQGFDWQRILTPEYVNETKLTLVEVDGGWKLFSVEDRNSQVYFYGHNNSNP